MDWLPSHPTIFRPARDTRSGPAGRLSAPARERSFTGRSAWAGHWLARDFTGAVSRRLQSGRRRSAVRADGGSELAIHWQYRVQDNPMNRGALATSLALAFCLPVQACSAPGQTDRPPSAASASGRDTMVVNGEGLRIDPGTRICVSGDVTLSSGLDVTGVNALTGAQLVTNLHGWADLALHRRGQPLHMPDNRSEPRVVRSESCDREDVALRATLGPGPDGGPYRVSLKATQGANTFTAEISRNGFVRAQPGVPVLAEDRLPDGRPYWDVSTDITRALKAFEASAVWAPASGLDVRK